MRSDRYWTLDKHVPVAMLFAIAVQTGTAIWWASGVSIRIDQLEKQAMTVAPQSERLIKLETKFDSLIDAVNEVKALLRQRPATRGND